MAERNSSDANFRFRVHVPRWDLQADLLSARNDHLETAYRHTTALWFPVNPEVLESIRDNLRHGCYEHNPGSFIADAKKDFSLYLFCLRRLSLMAARREDEPGRRRGVWPKQMSAAHLNGFLDLAPNHVSPHAIEKMTDVQALRLREAALSTAAAEALSSKISAAEQESIFTCSLLRQLGLTLIAWNYPSVYRHALDGLHRAESAGEGELDFVLHSLLGFSPAMLGVRYAHAWHLPEPLVAAVRAKNCAASDLDLRGSRNCSAAELISRACYVGECLARANNPLLYPGAREDWDRASSAISQCLGPAGVDLIYQKAQLVCRAYARYAPEIMQLEDDTPPKPLHSPAKEGCTAVHQNIYLRACPSELRRAIAELYAQRGDRTKLPELLRKLMHEIVPAMGFDASAVFTIDAVNYCLRPVLKFGTPCLIRLRTCGLIAAASDLHPVAQAFRQKGLLQGDGIDRQQQERMYFAQAIGGPKRIGVLYLEIPHHPSSGQTSALASARTMFFAVQQTLVDLLS